MNGGDEGLDTFLTKRRIVIGALIDRMLLGDLVRACARPGISDADVLAVIGRFDILHEPSEATP
jgi:hypothetical protein